MKITLTTPFLYQNPNTGTPSTTTLTCRQLCRLLCPSTAIAGSVGSGGSAQKSPINSTTQLLAYNTITQSYDIDGWKCANSIDVIREACCDTTWYYELRGGNGVAIKGSKQQQQQQQQQQARVEGPVTTRSLSKLYFVDGVIADRTRVYRCCSTSGNSASTVSNSTSTSTGKEGADNNSTAAHQEGGHSNNNNDEGWKEIQQLDNLLLAMEAFHDEQQNHYQTFDFGGSNNGGETTSGGGGNIDQMIFDNDNDNNDGINNDSGKQQQQQNVADELEAFLSSTDHLAPHANSSTKQQRNSGANNDEEDEEEEEYESDGGTRYIRDNQTGQWIHEALMMMQKEQQQQQQQQARDGGKNVGANNGKHENGSASAATAATSAATATKKRKRKNKPKFSAKSARNWIYITGLPHDTNMDELHTYFSKVGIIDIDPESLKPKIKLYRYKNSDGDGSGSGGKVGELKGDASICYARPESVELALQILDENLFRDGAILSVQRAKFQQRGDDNTGDNKSSSGACEGGTQRKQRRVISEAKRRVARLAAIQAVGWDEGENGRIAGGLKGLRIIVLMNMFDPNELALGNDDDDDDDDDDDENDNESTQRLRTLEREIHTKCEEIGTVEKITIFSKHPAGVVIVKFAKPNDASDAVKTFNGKVWEGAIGRKVEASFWDGITDYTVGGVEDAEKEIKETEKRLDKFGDWLEEQELPEEFRLRVEE